MNFLSFAHALFHAYFADDRDLSNPDVTGNVAAKLSVSKEELLRALNEPAVKERLRREVDAAIERGGFGSPYIVIDGEPFWGAFPGHQRWRIRLPIARGGEDRGARVHKLHRFQCAAPEDHLRLLRPHDACRLRCRDAQSRSMIPTAFAHHQNLRQRISHVRID